VGRQRILTPPGSVGSRRRALDKILSDATNDSPASFDAMDGLGRSPSSCWIHRSRVFATEDRMKKQPSSPRAAASRPTWCARAGALHEDHPCSATRLPPGHHSTPKSKRPRCAPSSARRRGQARRIDVGRRSEFTSSATSASSPSCAALVAGGRRRASPRPREARHTVVGQHA